MKKFYIILASLYCCIAYAQKVSIRIIPEEKWRFRFSVLNTQDILIKNLFLFYHMITLYMVIALATVLVLRYDAFIR